MLTDTELAESPIVANNRMNRLRGFRGVNSYEKDLKHNLTKTILAYTESSSAVHWLDIGCGVGKALIEASEYFKTKHPEVDLQLVGLDLVDSFLHTTTDSVYFESVPVHLWQATQSYQIITAVHSLHYFGDKLGILTKLLAYLAADGIFIGQVDLSSIYVDDVLQENSLATYFRSQGIEYHKKTKILQCRGSKTLTLPYQYLGASDRAGANYTGQAAVNAYYNKI